MPRRQYYSHKFQTTTLEFENKAQVLKFIETVPKLLFGDRASYELYCHTRPSPVPRADTQDWNAVIRGVDPDNDTADFEKAMTDHDIHFRRTSRILTATGDKTHMIRIYFDNKENANEAILNSISILGIRYIVEPPRMEGRHIPCWKCGQYGHLKAECKNEAICIKCGGKPGACNHAFNANVLYCATCGDKDHYTGQVRYRLYPRNETPQLDNRPMPLPPQTTNSPRRPSATDCPALSQNVWKTRHAEQDLDCNTTKTASKDTRERSFTEKLHDTIKTAMTEAMETTMRLLEKYVDEKNHAGRRPNGKIHNDAGKQHD